MENLKRVLYRLLAVVLVVTMVSGNFGGLTLEVEAEEMKTITGETNAQVDESDFPSNDELAMGYVESILYGDLQSSVATLGEMGENNLLNDSEKAFYAELKEQIKKIASGEEKSSIIEFENTVSMTWTAEELGVSEITESNVGGLFQARFDTIVDYLLMDCPYELYWYDKTGGIGISYGGSQSSKEVTISPTKVTMTVAAEYQDGDEYTVDSELAQGSLTAKTAASEVVEKYEASSDYEKLLGYKNEICSLTSYNDEAAADASTAYGNPWQLIWVFDGDDSTEVVCEGYSKAFQYLCDLSGLTCYTVTGTLAHGTGEGLHMWNVVTFEGKNYLVDVTNCDDGTVGAPDKLFLAGTIGNVTDGYSFTLSTSDSTVTKFVYDANQVSLFGTSILTLSDKNYKPREAATVTFSTETASVTYTGNEAVITPPTVVGDGETIQNADITYRYRSVGSEDEYTTGLPVNVGTYEIQAVVAEGTTYLGAVSSNELTLEITKATPTLQFVNYDPGKPYDGKTLALPTGDEITVSHGLAANVTYEWHKDSAEGESVEEPSAVGKYVLVASLEATSNTNAASISSDVFEIKQTYTITYELYGGTQHESNPTVFTEDSEITLAAPVRENYTFAGWYLTGEFTTSIEKIENTAENLTLYAKWLLNMEANASVGESELVCSYDETSDDRDEYGELDVTVTTIPADTGTQKYVISNSVGKEVKSGSFVNNSVADYSIDISYAEFAAGTYTLQVFCEYYDGEKNAAAYAEPITFTVAVEKREYPVNGEITWSDTKETGAEKTFADIESEIKDLLLADVEDKLHTTAGEKAVDGTITIQDEDGNPVDSSSMISSGTYRVVYTLNSENTYFKETAEAVLGIQYEAELPTQYNITYVLNVDNAVNSDTNKDSYVWYQETITLGDPACEGYDFIGWYSDPELTCADNTIEKGEIGDKTFYAKWAKRYDITYNLNGGTNNPDNPSAYNTETAVVFVKPTRSGYDFLGWYSDSKFKNAVNGIEKGSNGDKVVYAKWTKSYTITYNLKGGVNNSANPASFNSTTPTIKLKKPTKTGYTFKGWYSDSKYKTKVTKISKGTKANKKLYAKWEKTKYTVTYNLNNGKNSSSNPKNYYVTTKTITLKNPTRKGYTFQGWYTENSYTNKVTQITKGSTGNLKLYAKWEKTKYTITYNLKGGTNHSSNPADYYVTTSTIKLKNPTQKGYSFKGWYSSSKYKTKVTKIAKGSTGNKKLYAKWEKIKYTITYNLNGGKNSSSNPAGYYITTDTINFKNPTRKGYTFGGWYSDSKFTTKVTSIPKGSTGSVKLYAKWTVNQYSIHFDANGGFGTMTDITSCKVGKSYTLPLCDFVREGYYFKGWNTKANGKGTTYKNIQSVKNVTYTDGKTVTLYAIWGKCSSTELKYANQVVSQVNAQRTKYGVDKLTTDSTLTAIAQQRAKEIAMYFSHTRPDEESAWISLYDAAGYWYGWAGENIAYGYTTPTAVMNGWMNSEGHRNNILSENYTKIGVGCYYYNGRYYWVQNFSN